MLVKNATIVDVVTHTTYTGWFTVDAGCFVEVESGEPDPAAETAATAVVDVDGAYVQPGMLDIHMHIESSLVTPRRFAEAALPRGTTTVLQDPHEIANVLGAAGIRWMLEASRGLPLRVYTAVSSCVPATSASIETPNASITPADVTDLAKEAEVVALGEMMDFHGLIEGDEHLRAMLRAGADAGLTLEGHVPSLTGPELSRYIAHGIRSDHTLMTPTKLLEQLRKGMWVMIQEKSLTADVVATINALADRSRVLLITDDVMPNRLTGGHLDRVVRLAIAAGWEPIDAIASATVRPATYLGLHALGTVTPGSMADFIVTPELAAYPPHRVYVAGHLVAEAGRTVVPSRPSPHPTPVAGLDERFDSSTFDASSLRFGHDRKAHGREGDGASGDTTVRARVIEANDENSFTTLSERDVTLRDGVPVDPGLALAAVIPRAAARPGAEPFVPVVCLIAGLGLSSGAYATTFAHDSHNVFVVGREPEAMVIALTDVLAAGGGMAFAQADGESVLLRLPLAGLLSDDHIDEVAATFGLIETRLRAAGMTARNPVLLLTLMPLTVSPDYKLSDKGVVDVQGRRVLAPVLA